MQNPIGPQNRMHTSECRERIEGEIAKTDKGKEAIERSKDRTDQWIANQNPEDGKANPNAQEGRVTSKGDGVAQPGEAGEREVNAEQEMQTKAEENAEQDAEAERGAEVIQMEDDAAPLEEEATDRMN